MTDPKAALDNNNWNFLHDAVSHNDRAFHLAMRQQAASCFQKRLAGIQPKPILHTLSKSFKQWRRSRCSHPSCFSKKSD
jgi:hypothetical protein